MVIHNNQNYYLPINIQLRLYDTIEQKLAVFCRGLLEVKKFSTETELFMGNTIRVRERYNIL